jgi:integrase/recombinase XerC
MDQKLEAFTTHLQSQDVSEHTVKSYRRDVEAFFKWLTKQVGQDTPPVEVTAFDVQKYRDHLVDLGRKPATVNRRLAGLRAFFAWMVESEQMASNPAGDVKGVKQTRKVPKALDAQEVYKLQRTAAAQRQLAEAQAGEGAITPAVVVARRDEALLNLLLYTGLRVSEAAALTTDDVVINDRSGQVTVRSGKGRKHRELPLHKEVRKALKAYLKVRPQDRGESLFLGQRGTLGARGIQMRLAALGEAAGVEVTPHVLRHTFATRLLREVGTDLVTVSALLGHESVATTRQFCRPIYTQPSEADLTKAVEGLE